MERIYQTETGSDTKDDFSSSIFFYSNFVDKRFSLVFALESFFFALMKRLLSLSGFNRRVQERQDK